ncbi:MAG: type IV toxin-antitoxin system AbiEi family antitoxin domain-containing protein [Acidimicrobiales bacterium]
MTDIDRAIVAVARRQHGAFSRAQAFELGASDRFIRRRLADGTWSRIAPSVYVLSDSAGTWLRQCKVAELATPGSAIAGPSAAVLHNLDGFRPGSIDLVVPPTANTRHAVARCHRFAGALTTTVNRLRVTTIAQTLVDLTALRVPPWVVEPAMDGALLEKRLAVEQLEERRRFYEGSRRHGNRLLRALVAERAADGWVPPASELGAKLRKLLDTVPGARFVREAPAPWRSPQPHRVDALEPAHRLIIEADGRRWHARVADFDRDRWRDNEAAAHGYRVLRFTWVHLTEAADDVRELVVRTLAA